MGRPKIHGHAGHKNKKASPEYYVWQGMVARCTNPRASKFDRYGGSGVFVCDRWRSFAAFLADMGPRPARTTIDRIDGGRGYEPSNCRWATAAEQNQNRKCARLVTINGETMPAAAWARQAGLSNECFYQRLRVGDSGVDLLRPKRPHVRKRGYAGNAEILPHLRWSPKQTRLLP